MDMWRLAFLILVFGSSGRANTVKVYFQSENFRNVLHWDPLDSPDNQTVLYSVEYNEYGEPFKAKKGCQSITTLSCDLTQETPLTKPLSKYTAQVTVGGKKIGETVRFCPFMNTVLGPPNVSVTLNTSAMTVRVDLPLGPNNQSLGQMLYPPVYNLILTPNTSGETITQMPKNSGVFTVSKLQGGTEYCGSVTYNIGELKIRERSKASTFCKIVPGDVEEVPFLFLLPIGIVVLLLAVIPALLWRLLIVKKVAKPESLNVTSNASAPLAASEKNNISKIELQPEKAIMTDLMPEKKEFTVNDHGYHPQDNQAEPWHCETYTTQQAEAAEESHGSALSSPNYCLVVVDLHNTSKGKSSPVVDGPGADISNRPLATGADLHQMSDAANGAPTSPGPETLILQISPGGTLQLPFLCQPPGLSGARDPEEETSERTALLSEQPEATQPGDQALFHPQLSDIIVYSSQEVTAYSPQEVSQTGATNSYISNEVVPPSSQNVSDTCNTNTYISNEVVPSSEQGPTSYLPVQEHLSPFPMASSTQSPYRQNWLPESFTGPGPGVSLQSVWVNFSEGHNQDLNTGKGIVLK